MITQNYLKTQWGTTKHKFWVLWYMTKFCYQLIKRALLHDLSKYKWVEAKHFAREVPKLEKLDYGTKEYEESLERLDEALKHHYNNNKHHPEYFSKEYPNWMNPVEAMDTISFIEMVVDWKAATLRHETGDIWESIKINSDDYDIKPSLKAKIQDIVRAIE